MGHWVVRITPKCFDLTVDAENSDNAVIEAFILAMNKKSVNDLIKGADFCTTWEDWDW